MAGPRIASDENRDSGGRGGENGPGQRERSEGLVVEKVPPEGRDGRGDGGLPGERFGKEHEARQHGSGDRVVEPDGQVPARHDGEPNREGSREKGACPPPRNSAERRSGGRCGASELIAQAPRAQDEGEPRSPPNVSSMAFHQPSGMPAQTALPSGWRDAPAPKPMPPPIAP